MKPKPCLAFYKQLGEKTKPGHRKEHFLVDSGEMTLFLVPSGSGTWSVPGIADRRLMRATGVAQRPPLRSPYTQANLVNRLIEHGAASEASGTLGLFFPWA